MPWTNIPNANLAAGAPIRSVDLLAIRDNISAVPNADAGAPKIYGNAILRASELPTLSVTSTPTYDLLSTGDYGTINNIQQTSANFRSEVTAVGNVFATQSPSYVVSHRIINLNLTGTVRIRYMIRDATNGGRAWGRLLRNGVVISGPVSNQTGTWLTTTITTQAIAVNDIFELQIYQQFSGSDANGALSADGVSASNGYRAISPLSTISYFNTGS